jgi:D-lactate dehydrogenase (cytochrome)
MPGHSISTRPARGEARPTSLTLADDVAAYLQDAARTPGGHTPEVCLPRTEADVSQAVRAARALLPVGAQSSLTGGATPFGETVLSLARMDATLRIDSDRVRVEAGVALVSLEEALAPRRLFYPPVPTFRGAFIGGTVATNASGAATFKYGSTRRWVQALTIVLANGDVLDVERGECQAHPDGHFDVILASGEKRRVPVPTYRMPQVPKRSAGYHAEAGMDLVDLFVGSEGTLGVITEAELAVIPAPARLLAIVTLATEKAALTLVGALREAAQEAWSSHDPRALDVAAIESMDARCLEMLRSDGKDREHRIRLDPSAGTAILVQIELPAGATAADVMDQAALFEAGTLETPIAAFLGLVREAGALDSVELSLPGDTRRAQQLLALREAVPMAVNHRVAEAQRARPGVRKTAADMIVPFESLGGMMDFYREGFTRRGLDHALWGHVSDGNIHANVIPRTEEDVRCGEEAFLEFAAEVSRLGGCPLSEHGVGRSACKQELLRRLYGDRGIEEMRQVKAALDPEGKLAPGVVFPRDPSTTGRFR